MGPGSAPGCRGCPKVLIDPHLYREVPSGLGHQVPGRVELMWLDAVESLGPARSSGSRGT